VIRSARRFAALTSTTMLTLALLAAPAFAQAEEDESSNTFWFNDRFLRFTFLGLLIVVLLALIVGYIVKVIVPKYRGRPA